MLSDDTRKKLENIVRGKRIEGGFRLAYPESDFIWTAPASGSGGKTGNHPFFTFSFFTFSYG